MGAAAIEINMRVTTQFPDFRATRSSLNDIFKNLPQWAGNEYLNNSVSSFRRGGYIDNRFEPWPERKNKDEGRATLVKRGALRRSIRMRFGADWFEIFTESEYAKLHNEGGRVEVTKKMRGYFWAMHYKAKKRKQNEDADFWRSLALTKKPYLEFPKRQFMGDSGILRRRVVAQVERGLRFAFRN